MPVAFPKPKDIRRAVPYVCVFPDGREVCADTKLGKQEYVNRVHEMVERQGNRCCLEAYAPMCPGYLHKDEASFEHEGGRGHGGGKRDDRTKLPDGTWMNGAAHVTCNIWKASRYIDYNRGVSAMKTAERIKIPQALSPGEEAFALQCVVYGFLPQREFVFHPTRKWRFDFAFPELRIAVEIEGGTWSQGRHNRGSGMEADCEKYNSATLLGWDIFRFTTAMVLSGQAIDTLLPVLGRNN